MIIREMQVDEAGKIKEIDRSERIDLIYVNNKNDGLKEIKAGHECPTWSLEELDQLINRFKFEVTNGGKAYGAFDKDCLVGFGVLGHKFRGTNKDQLQIDLMYVTRAFRRQGIGRQLMDELSREARHRGARSLYISSTETESAVNFYKSSGSELTTELDDELFALEPNDIHMIKKL
ncbi:GNAT family N-acetyltransferase [Paenibacillus sp. SYP-B3998]|uniref:GNAT family N-acetyltransferase n=1 Tax=Paenibacillus sp. SYP-B3998 TaxID=2678564 RepID=A0A6G3ZX84_9BACL|nr:GNAT family N-acetyltransferase [Paenibacillus sp. SYP-B3998]NEW06690.1 GNAT family N-acetyltransferase [Paenibacillus sp. SYP-B3998]